MKEKGIRVTGRNATIVHQSSNNNAFSDVYGHQVGSERQTSVLDSKLSSQKARRISAADYEIKAYAMSDKQGSDYQ